MSLLITILAYLLNSISLTIDKFLLSKSIPNPISYVFYINAIGLISLLLLPFTKIPSLYQFFLFSSTTIIWSLAAFFMFQAIKTGFVARVVPMIGVVTSLLLLFQQTMDQSIGTNQTIAVCILILGLILITASDLRKKIIFKEISLEILSGFLFALFYIVLKISYIDSDFLSVLVWSKIIIIPTVLIIFLVPLLKRKIIGTSGEGEIKLNSLSGIIFSAGQIIGGLSGFFIYMAVAFSNPAFVSSMQGIQYVFLFLFTILLTRKFPSIFHLEATFLNISTKMAGIILIFSGLFLLSTT